VVDTVHCVIRMPQRPRQAIREDWIVFYDEYAH
jgi:hypothetical protein